MADVLTIFDLDGTLIEFNRVVVTCPMCGGTTRVLDGGCKACTDGLKPFHKQETYDDVIPLPGRARILEQLRLEGHKLAIATNQTDLAFDRITMMQVSQKLASVADALGPFDKINVAFGHLGARPPFNDATKFTMRKPCPTILTQLVKAFKPRCVLFVGDTRKDQLAAAAAGIGYMDANDFFLHAGWHDWIEESQLEQASRV